MKTETFSGTVESAWGNKLPESVDFSGSYEAFENANEVKQAAEWPSDSDIVEMVNTKRKATERAKATVKALDAKYDAVVKAEMAAGKTEDQAKQTAAVYKKLDASTPEGQRENLIKAILKANKGFDRARAEQMAASLIVAQ